MHHLCGNQLTELCVATGDYPKEAHSKGEGALRRAEGAPQGQQDPHRAILVVILHHIIVGSASFLHLTPYPHHCYSNWCFCPSATFQEAFRRELGSAIVIASGFRGS